MTERRDKGTRPAGLTRVGDALPPVMSIPLRSRFGRSRERELEVLDHYVAPGDTVVDIGAHKGLYTYRLSKLAGASGKVIAYEPLPSLARYLRRGAAIGPMKRVEVRERALSESDGTATLSVPLHDGAPILGLASLRTTGAEAEQQVSVEVSTIDGEQFPGPLRFVKIDVEGHELSVLRGAAERLRTDRPVLLVEIVHYFAHDRVEDLAEMLLSELGYNAHEVSPDGTIVETEGWRWSAGPALNERDGYRNFNFLFVP